jgi:membrane protease YdiL (CAAX protease family)
MTNKKLYLIMVLIIIARLIYIFPIPAFSYKNIYLYYLVGCASHLPVNIIATYFIFKDCRKNKIHPLPWSFFAFLDPFLSLPIYVISMKDVIFKVGTGEQGFVSGAGQVERR